jgi:dihydrofolate synthase / folylpolyglutamate synthase
LPFVFAHLFLWQMNYTETIDFLYTRLPMFSKVGSAAYKPNLSNTIKLCAALDNPHQKIKTVHVAGTNGKGSVSHMLAAILQTAGYKTGLYTSPHLKDFRERIKIDGEMVRKEFVIDFTQKVNPLIDELEPSFFEITVAMAYEYFAAEKVDIAIIETGLGGRLDSTNIITPELSIITNIGWDHMNILGDTLEKIAAEKAGIIKPHIPIVIGEIQPETKYLFETIAQEKKSPIFFAPENRTAALPEWETHLLKVSVTDTVQHTKKYELELPGIYQTKNLLTVLEAVSQLQHIGWKISERDISTGLKTTKQLTGLHGRWEVIHTKPTIVLDVAHNVNGMEQLLLQIEKTPHKKLHIILGMVKDKDVTKVLSLLPTNAAYYFTRAAIPRAMPEDELMEKAAGYGLKGQYFVNVNFALYNASHHTKEEDLVIVCGSIFLVGEVSTAAVKNLWEKESSGILPPLHWLDLLSFFE